MGIIFAELKRGCILRQSIKIHLKEVHCEFTVQIMKFIVVFLIAFQIILGDLSFIV